VKGRAGDKPARPHICGRGSHVIDALVRELVSPHCFCTIARPRWPAIRL